MNIETNFMSFENLTKLIEEHKKETHPYKRYEFDSTGYTLLLISINNLIKENQKLKKQLEELKFDIVDGKPYIKLDTVLTKQQKFINYLEDKISKQKNDIFANALISEDIDLYIIKIKLQELEKILQKYKEIIGDKE